MYRQIDGVAMGSPLGPALANIFVGYYESKLFNEISKPTVYCRYVDDTFSLFHKETEFQKFLNCLNSLHPSLKFTNEIETNNSLPFLDVLVTKSDNKFITSVYRKPIFTGQYIHWNSFGPKQRKANLIDTLTQWFPTAGPRTGAGPHKFFAGPRSILFSAKIILIWNHNHCKDVNLCKTHFTPGQFAAVKLTYLAFHC